MVWSDDTNFAKECGLLGTVKPGIQPQQLKQRNRIVIQQEALSDGKLLIYKRKQYNNNLGTLNPLL